MVYQLVSTDLSAIQNPALIIKTGDVPRLYQNHGPDGKPVWVAIDLIPTVDDGDIPTVGIRIPKATVSEIGDTHLTFVLPDDDQIALSAFFDKVQDQYKALYASRDDIYPYWTGPKLVVGKRHKNNKQVVPLVGSKVTDLVLVPLLSIGVQPDKDTPADLKVSAKPTIAFGRAYLQIASWSDPNVQAATVTATKPPLHTVSAPRRPAAKAKGAPLVQVSPALDGAS